MRHLVDFVLIVQRICECPMGYPTIRAITRLIFSLVLLILVIGVFYYMLFM